MSPEERAAAFFREVPEVDGPIEDALADANAEAKAEKAREWGVDPGTPKWVDLFGSDPDYPDPTSRTLVEWGVRRTRGDVGSVAGPMWRHEAEHAARTWPGELVSRKVTYGEWATS